ncbi:hypothetical protein Fot_50963 [Forsythia ovata]|uniref:RNase H type-1 domain-containing protein n=1 Tax=Forsythia ovata TaxID=205694 RepID=A0ABD1Q0L1_9LAMI
MSVANRVDKRLIGVSAINRDHRRRVIAVEMWRIVSFLSSEDDDVVVVKEGLLLAQSTGFHLDRVEIDSLQLVQNLGSDFFFCPCEGILIDIVELLKWVDASHVALLLEMGIKQTMFSRLGYM